MSNFRIASGSADVRSKLLSTGFSTSGILFKSGSSEILPESYGILKEIAQVLLENTSLKFRLTGHTDNIGDNKSNLRLSEQRARSIGHFLASQYKIDTGNFVFDGKGSTLPVADNQTQEGRAQNRRVEFLKL